MWYVVLWALTLVPAYYKEQLLLIRNLKLLLLTMQTADGNWKRTANSSSLCASDAEPTSYAIIALCRLHAFLSATGQLRADEGTQLTEAVKRGLAALRSCSRFSGHSSSRDTLFATWAASEAAAVMAAPKPVKFAVRLGDSDQVWKAFDLSQPARYASRTRRGAEHCE